MRIDVVRGDLTEVGCDALVNPANSLGLMGGGVALALKRKGGEEIELEARSKAPIPVGKAIATTAGKLRAKHIIHAPTMEEPAGRTSLEKVELAVKAALAVARDLGVKSVAFPGMGTGVGGLPKQEVARVMVETIRKFAYELEVVLVAYDEELERAFREALDEVGKS